MRVLSVEPGGLGVYGQDAYGTLRGVATGGIVPAFLDGPGGETGAGEEPLLFAVGQCA